MSMLETPLEQPPLCCLRLAPLDRHKLCFRDPRGSTPGRAGPAWLTGTGGMSVHPPRGQTQAPRG